MKFTFSVLITYLVFLVSCKENNEDIAVNTPSNNGNSNGTTTKEKLTPVILKIEPSLITTGDTITIYGENLWGTQSNEVLFSNIYSNVTADVKGKINSKGTDFIKVIVPSDPLYNELNVRVIRGDSISAMTSKTRINIKSKFWKRTQGVSFGNQWVSSFAINEIGYFVDDSKNFRSFNPADNSTSSINFLPTGSSVITSFSIGSKGYIMMDSDLKLALWQFDPSVESWVRKADCNIKPFFLNGFTFTVGSVAYIGGGSDGIFVSYDAVENKWTKLANYPGVNADGVSATALNGTGYCFGGGFSTRQLVDNKIPSLTNYNKNWKYDPAQNLWIQVADLPDNVIDRSYGVLSVSNNMIYFGSGYSNLLGSALMLGAIYEFSPTTNVWKLHNFAPVSRAGMMSLGFQAKGKTYLKELYSGSSDFLVFDLN